MRSIDAVPSESEESHLGIATPLSVARNDNLLNKLQNNRMQIQYSVFKYLICVFYIWFLIFNFISCKSQSPTASSETLPSQIVTDFKLFESTSGQKQYSLIAEKAYVYDVSQKINVTKPYITFYNEAGNVSSILIAQSGQVNSKNSDLLAKDSVVVRTSDSTILYTDSLVWNNINRTIVTDAWVKIQSNQGLIEGQGLISDAQLKKIEIKSSVTGKSKYEF